MEGLKVKDPAMMSTAQLESELENIWAEIKIYEQQIQPSLRDKEHVKRLEKRYSSLVMEWERRPDRKRGKTG